MCPAIIPKQVQKKTAFADNVSTSNCSVTRTALSTVRMGHILTLSKTARTEEAVRRKTAYPNAMPVMNPVGIIALIII